MNKHIENLTQMLKDGLTEYTNSGMYRCIEFSKTLSKIHIKWKNITV